MATENLSLTRKKRINLGIVNLPNQTVSKEDIIKFKAGLVLARNVAHEIGGS